MTAWIRIEWKSETLANSPVVQDKKSRKTRVE